MVLPIGTREDEPENYKVRNLLDHPFQWFSIGSFKHRNDLSDPEPAIALYNRNLMSGLGKLFPSVSRGQQNLKTNGWNIKKHL